jgi:putative SOS response-associated peptidase YedK
MCSRFSLTAPPEAIATLFRIARLEAFPPRPNIRPTEPILIVRRGLKVEREPMLVRWGLIPSWVKDPREFATLINARAETVGEKPSFRAALRHRRCLIPANAFYEWTGPPKARQPNRIAMTGDAVFAFAGLYETWLGADGSEIDTATILTTAANDDIAALHDRMPLVVDETDFEIGDLLTLRAPDVWHHRPVGRNLDVVEPPNSETLI